MNSEQFNELLHQALAGNAKALRQWYQLVSTELIPQKNIKHALLLVESVLLEPQDQQRANALFLRASMHEYGQGGALDSLAASTLYGQAKALSHPLALEIDLDDLEEFNLFLKKIKKNKALKELFHAINQMKHYGIILAAQDAPKGKVIERHAEKLLSEVDFFILRSCKEEPTEEDIARFRLHFNQTLHEKDELISIHREQWKPIVVNIAMLISGIGLLALFLRVAKNWYNDIPMTFNNNCFFAQTNSQKLNNDIHFFIDALSADVFAT